MTPFQRLLRLLDHAYAPYSHFRVASIVVDEEGRGWEGVNVESASYGLTLCAERAAIFGAIARGMRPGSVREVHILARDLSGRFMTAMPCGACRQVIHEHSEGRAVVVVHYDAERSERFPIADLLPHAFVLDVTEKGGKGK